MSGGIDGPAHLPRAADRALEAVVERYGLPDDARGRLRALVKALAEDPLAPTTVRDPVAVVKDHIADALVALELAPVRVPGTVADLGAGAGIPGLPLAIALPATHVSLVESNARKCAFIKRAIAVCGLTNAAAVTVRAEAWAGGLGAHDLVTARALAPLVVVAEYAAPLLSVGGSLVAWRGRRDPEGEAAMARAAGQLGLTVGAIVRVEPYPGAEHRHLHVITRTGPFAPGFPRRPGMARKRPLGAP